MSEIQLQPQQRAQALTLTQRAAQFKTIETPEQYTACLEFIKDCRTFRAGVEKYFQDAREKAHAAWKAITTLISGANTPVEELEKAAEAAAKRWHQAQEAKRQEEERRRREEAETVEREQREIAAMMAEEEGDRGVAMLILEAPSTAPPVHVPKEEFVPTVAGASTPKKWKAEVTDPLLLAAAIGAGTIPIEAIKSWNQKFLDARASEYKSKLASMYPGVRAYEDTGFRFAKD